MGETADSSHDAQDVDQQALEDAANEAILACGGDAIEAIKALIIANAFLEDELTKVSYGYDRGRTRARQAG